MEKRETGMAGMEMRLMMAPVLALVQTVATTASGQSPPPGSYLSTMVYYGTGMMGGYAPGYYGPRTMGGFWLFSGIVVPAGPPPQARAWLAQPAPQSEWTKTPYANRHPKRRGVYAQAQPSVDAVQVFREPLIWRFGILAGISDA